jgi:predicted site-specific integrase-resolvase
MTQNLELIGTTEAAVRLGVDRATVTRWVKAGRLEATKLSSDQKNAPLVFAAAAVDVLAANLKDADAAR